MMPGENYGSINGDPQDDSVFNTMGEVRPCVKYKMAGAIVVLLLLVAMVITKFVTKENPEPTLTPPLPETEHNDLTPTSRTPH
jgi:hypothetical protein